MRQKLNGIKQTTKKQGLAMSKLVYIASPFSKIWDKEFAVFLAEKACDEVAKMGFYPVSPVLLWLGE